MIFARRSVCQDVIGDTAVGYLVVAHPHCHRHHRRHRLDTRDIRLSQPLDKGQHRIEVTAKTFDFFLRNRHAREVRNPTDSFRINRHSCNLSLYNAVTDTSAIAEGR